ncbi:MAG: DUF3737 family protein [Lachnospiraceae bacterium]|nr:DUF3737 family protein [Lachnospiraceae bacterium]
MIRIENQVFDEERALYGCEGIRVVNCRFDGPADGESAFKEGKDIEVEDCYFNLRYPFWHDTGLQITNSEMTELCRAALWYSEDIEITGTRMHGIKALRECKNVAIRDCDIISPEYGWSSADVTIRDSRAEGEYFMLRGEGLKLQNVQFKGKYSFQYVSDCVFENCNLDTKDAFWHARNVVVKNSIVKGEYMAWYCENVTFENCTIIGTQPLCYCKGLKLINCQMLEADLAFEKSEVEATITTPVISIKNPVKGFIRVPAVNEIISDNATSTCEIVVEE